MFYYGVRFKDYYLDEEYSSDLFDYKYENQLEVGQYVLVKTRYGYTVGIIDVFYGKEIEDYHKAGKILQTLEGNFYKEIEIKEKIEEMSKYLKEKANELQINLLYKKLSEQDDEFNIIYNEYISLTQENKKIQKFGFEDKF